MSFFTFQFPGGGHGHAPEHEQWLYTYFIYIKKKRSLKICKTNFIKIFTKWLLFSNPFLRLHDAEVP